MPLSFVFPYRYYLKCYIFVSQLEALNIPYTVRSFLSSPKEGLVKGLWKNHSHEPQVLSYFLKTIPTHYSMLASLG